MLYLVSTPIWNLEDITYRAVRILKEADIIACEDTRTSSVLLNHYWIKWRLESFHSHSDDAKITKLISLLLQWSNIALISDAWTPWISDPAYVLVKRAIENWIEVSPIPWASAILSWLVASWMHTHDFRFLWFLPIKKWRQTLFLELQNKEYTAVIYESVHRIWKTLEDIEKYFWKDHKIVIWRELTKKFEQFLRMPVSECIEYFKKNTPKWEFVVIF